MKIWKSSEASVSGRHKQANRGTVRRDPTHQVQRATQSVRPHSSELTVKALTRRHPTFVTSSEGFGQGRGEKWAKVKSMGMNEYG